MVLEFIAAVYNEEKEIGDLINHVKPYVDYMYIVDDGSTDRTSWALSGASEYLKMPLTWKTIEHTGLPETVKHEALQMTTDGAWIIMLDADERFEEGILPKIVEFIKSPTGKNTDYVYFNQVEIIDGVAVRQFQKAKLFRKEAVRFPLNNIHADDQFIGNGIHKPDWVVYHRKTSDKQKLREKEYIETYARLRKEGHIDEGRERWLQGLHHYIKS